MKAIFSLFAAFLLLNISACNRRNDDIKGSGDEVTIERQEDYESDDVRGSRNLPLERNDEIEVDRDVFDDDEIEIDD